MKNRQKTNEMFTKFDDVMWSRDNDEKCYDITVWTHDDTVGIIAAKVFFCGRVKFTEGYGQYPQVVMSAASLLNGMLTNTVAREDTKEYEEV